MIKLINRGKYEVSVLEEFEHFAQTTTSFLSQIFDALGEPVPAPATEAGKPGKFPPTAHHETHDYGGSDAIVDLDASVLTSGVIAVSRLPPYPPPTSHHETHETGGIDEIVSLSGAVLTTGTVADARLTPNVLTVAGGYPGGTTTFLRADGTFGTPTGVTPSAHHTTHEPGGSDALVNAAWTNVSNVFTANQKHEGPLGLIYQADRSAAAGLQAWGTAAGQYYQIIALNDSYGYLSTPLSLDRTGNLTIQGYLNAVGGINADQILSGTLADARLTSNVLKVSGGFPGGTTNFLRADGSFALPNVTQLTGYPGGTTTFLRADGAFVLPNVTQLTGYPGGTTTFLRADGNFATPPVGITLPLMVDLTFGFDGLIRRDTADGADSGALSLCGGGALGTSRGASIYITGNEAGAPGSMYLDLGNVTDPIFMIRNPSLTSMLEVHGSGVAKLYGPVTITGSIQNDQLTLDSGAATGGFLAFKRSGGTTLGYVGNAGIVGGGGSGGLDDFALRAGAKLVLGSDSNLIVAMPIYNNGQTVGTNVYVDANGHLSRFTSSRRYKQDIVTYADAGACLKLRPVTFAPRRDPAARHLGFIAEEAAEADRRFAIMDPDDEPEAINPVAILAACVATIQALEFRLSVLEADHADV